MKKWTILDTGVRSASENITLDEVLLTSRNKNYIPNTIRFLQFSPNNVLVGFHQNVNQEIRIEYCKNHGIDINRRITGGGAIYIDKPQLGWELVANRNNPIFPKDMENLYERICKCSIRGLKSLGVKAEFRPKNDIEVEGRKISGTGGAFEGNAFLFQGTLLTDFDVDTMIRALKIPIEKLKDKELESVKERVTCLKWELGYSPRLNIIKKALLEGFVEVLDIDLKERKLTDKEIRLFEEKIKHYQSDKWIYGIRHTIEHRQVLKSIYKTPGGLIRISLIVDIPNKRIQAALITGDFFIHPKRTVYDLEALLKDIPMDRIKIKDKILQFFNERQVESPGVTSDDFIKAINKALDKINFLKLGISLENVNNVFTIIESIDNIKRSSVFLIPYCSKLPECKYRNEKGCKICGKCTVGEIYELALDNNMKPITILSFEDLIRTLNDLKQSGVKSFIGSCCEAFYIKHIEDFQNAGLPGILIDIDSQTCYDLGKVKEAKEGNFENLTHLRVDLIKKVVDYFK